MEIRALNDLLNADLGIKLSTLLGGIKAREVVNFERNKRRLARTLCLGSLAGFLHITSLYNP